METQAGDSEPTAALLGFFRALIGDNIDAKITVLSGVLKKSAYNFTLVRNFAEHFG